MLFGTAGIIQQLPQFDDNLIFLIDTSWHLRQYANSFVEVYRVAS